LSHQVKSITQKLRISHVKKPHHGLGKWSPKFEPDDISVVRKVGNGHFQN